MNRGFTLIEMLIAAALSAMLMIALLGVCTAIARSDRAMAAQADSGDTAMLLDLFRRDLGQAQTLTVLGDTVVLEGHGGLGRASLDTAHQPVRVTYHMVQAGESRQLVREQTELMDLTNRNTWSELVSTGVERFSLEPIVDGSASALSKSDGTSNPQSGSGGSETDPPSAFRLQVEWTASNRTPLDAVIFTR